MSEKDQNQKLQSDDLIKENDAEGKADIYSRKDNTEELNVAPLSRKKSSYIDIEKAKEEAYELLSGFGMPFRKQVTYYGKNKYES